MPPQDVSGTGIAHYSTAAVGATLFTHDKPTPTEEVGSTTILQALTDDEIARMPDNHMPLRHWRAEKGDATQAIAKIKATLEWRKEFQVDTLLQACCGNEPNDMTPIVQKENETCKLYVRGYDQDGRALLYMRPAMENTNDAVNNVRHLVWNLEKAIACSSKQGRSKICIVIDYDGFSLRHAPPFSTSRHILDILQRHYPERLHKAYICNPPFVFRTFWTLIKPFIDPVTKAKIVFCSGKSGLAQVAADVGPANLGDLEPCVGGTVEQPPVVSQNYLSLPFDQAYGEK